MGRVVAEAGVRRGAGGNHDVVRQVGRLGQHHVPVAKPGQGAGDPPLAGSLMAGERAGYGIVGMADVGEDLRRLPGGARGGQEGKEGRYRRLPEGAQ